MESGEDADGLRRFRTASLSFVTDGQHHLALVKGDVAGKTNVLVRVHSECLTGDVFGSRRCDCGPQLHQAMRQVAEEGRGVIALHAAGRAGHRAGFQRSRLTNCRRRATTPWKRI